MSSGISLLGAVFEVIITVVHATATEYIVKFLVSPYRDDRWAILSGTTERCKSSFGASFWLIHLHCLPLPKLPWILITKYSFRLLTQGRSPYEDAQFFPNTHRCCLDISSRLGFREHSQMILQDTLGCCLGRVFFACGGGGNGGHPGLQPPWTGWTTSNAQLCLSCLKQAHS